MKTIKQLNERLDDVEELLQAQHKLINAITNLLDIDKEFKKEKEAQKQRLISLCIGILYGSVFATMITYIIMGL